MIPTIVAVPVRDHFDDFTAPLVAHLLTAEDVDHVLVLDNGSTDGTPEAVTAMAPRDPRLSVVVLSTESIYGLWNYAQRYAMGVAAGYSAEKANLALLNNDLRLLPGSMTRLGSALRSHDDLWAVSVNPDRRVEEGFGPPRVRFVHGSYRHGGLVGWAFMVAAEKWGESTLVETPYEWWYGDDELSFLVEEHGGKVARELGVPCDHVLEGTARSHPWTDEAKGRDAEKFTDRWGAR